MLKIFFLLFFFLTTSFNTLFCHPSQQRKIREGKFLLEGSNFRFYPSFLHLFLYKYSWNIIGYLKDRSLYIYLHWTRFRIKPILSYNTVTSDKITFKTNSHESKKMLCKVVTQANLLVFCSFFPFVSTQHSSINLKFDFFTFSFKEWKRGKLLYDDCV